jgi:imidazole glycerol phosphate synthase subunit HisF
MGVECCGCYFYFVEVGGGIASLEDIQLTLSAGASKVSMNSAVVKDPSLKKCCTGVRL